MSSRHHCLTQSQPLIDEPKHAASNSKTASKLANNVKTKYKLKETLSCPSMPCHPQKVVRESGCSGSTKELHTTNRTSQNLSYMVKTTRKESNSDKPSSKENTKSPKHCLSKDANPCTIWKETPSHLLLPKEPCDNGSMELTLPVPGKDRLGRPLSTPELGVESCPRDTDQHSTKKQKGPESAIALACNSYSIFLSVDQSLSTNHASNQKSDHSPSARSDSALYQQPVAPHPTSTSCGSLCVPSQSRNVKTAPSTPEVECRAPPRHAESTSQLELSASFSKRSSNGLTGIKGLDASLDQSQGRTHLKEVSPKMNKSRNDKFHKIFKNVPDTEIVLKSYLCAYVGDILLQGYLYVSPNFFCFYTKILGHEKQLEIPVAEVVNITREKTAFIIPNAIGVLTNKDKFVFGSLMQRDSTYRLIVSVWKKVNPGPTDAHRVTDSELSDEKDDDYFDASGTERKRSEPGDNISTYSDTSDTSICSECGTPMTEHEPGCECDNLPNSSTILDSTICAGESDDTTDGINRLKPSISRSHRASPLKRETSAITAMGKSQTCHDKTKHTKWGLPCFGLESKYALFNRKTRWVKSMPRTNVLLITSLVIAVMLVLSAAMMSYKILLLQAQLEHSVEWLDPTTSKFVNSHKLYSDMYYLNNRFHTSTIERFHSVLEANIQLLSQVHESLHSLQDSPILSDLKDCPTPENSDYGNS